ncbi:MAG: hypothetical protein JO053_16275 [Acidobacteria bacterium]|nr:hypothetical protein [Acidobacteriota bacterium]
MHYLFRSLSVIALICTCGALLVFAQDYKVTQVTTVQGQRITNTVYVKGPRKRTEGGGIMGMGKDNADIEQCDLKQNVKLNNKKRLYLLEPFGDDDSAATPKGPAAKPRSVPSTKGGVVTYVNNVTDTGERKQMFGMTARHVKTSMSMEASPDACNKQDMKMESDGWYVDLPTFSCPIRMSPGNNPQFQAPSGGCQDTIHYRNTGSGKLGFALSETRTMSMGDAGMSFTTTTDTTDFSRATLEQALFEIPQGYTATTDSSDLYSRPSIAEMKEYQKEEQTQMETGPAPPLKDPGTIRPKAPGVTRIGVLEPTNHGDSVNTANLQAFLAERLTMGKVEAIAVASEADARTANCDYVLASDFTKLKQASMGLFGNVVGKIAGAPSPYDAQVEYRLTPLAGGKTVANKAGGKSGSDAYTAAQAVLTMEAQAISSALGKN